MNPSKSSRASALLVVSALALAFSSGCAARRQQSYLEDKAMGHVYRKPIAEVWPAALALVKEKGFSVTNAQTGFETTTEWLMTSAPSSLGTSYARYLVRGFERGPGQCAVEFRRQDRSESRAADSTDGRANEQREGVNGAGNSQMRRDSELEWELLQKVDPDAASALKAEAKKIE
ncbi:hypothetical protein D7X30_09035 [Corallococcus sp. AB011P]|uniref:hypothetical protein n=1 Tax=unclassified Corallococcus TaxID=2685029 RepID=UPI000EA0719C|nr:MULTISPECIES: hypothetical protein [unclassified Corallococcus]RKG61029.1 hypothetical protein D7X30_09035 [Corallococcus sp. AB011P]RKH91927.1 hypothetical protein D7Y21_00650 [Corallococcus sp. AB045]